MNVKVDADQGEGRRREERKTKETRRRNIRRNAIYKVSYNDNYFFNHCY